MLSKHYRDELKLQMGISPAHPLSLYLLVVSGKYLFKQKGSLSCNLKLPLQIREDH